MAYRVQILARYGDFVDDENGGKIVFEGVFEDEDTARDQIKLYMEDETNKLSIIRSFSPDYFTVNLFERGTLSSNWELLYNESIPF